MFVVQWIGTALQKIAFRYSTAGLSNAIDNDVVNKISCEVAADEQIFVTVADVIVMLATYSHSKSATLVQHLDPNERQRTHKNIQARILNINTHVKKEIEPKICWKSEESIENLLRSPFRVDVLPHLATRKCQNISNKSAQNSSIEPSPVLLVFLLFSLICFLVFFIFLFHCTFIPTQESIKDRADFDSSNFNTTYIEDFSWIQIGSVVWVQEGTQPGIRGPRSIAYVGTVQEVYGDGNVSVLLVQIGYLGAAFGSK